MATVSITESSLISAVTSGDVLSAISNMVKPGYSITFDTLTSDNPLSGSVGADVFTPTSWVGVDLVGEASVSSAPLEKGKYTSYNKVQRPRQISVIFTLEGWTGYSGKIANYTNGTTLSREKLLSTLETMRTNAYTYNVETPDTMYESFDLIRFNYTVKADNGVTLLTVNALFQEVLATAETSLSK